MADYGNYSSEPRNEVIKLKVTKDEKKIIMEYCKKEKISVSGLLRRALWFNGVPITRQSNGISWMRKW
jgi:hypothetical protein